jgi:hypothetical protein
VIGTPPVNEGHGDVASESGSVQSGVAEWPPGEWSEASSPWALKRMRTMAAGGVGEEGGAGGEDGAGDGTLGGVGAGGDGGVLGGGVGAGVGVEGGGVLGGAGGVGAGGVGATTVMVKGPVGWVGR